MRVKCKVLEEIGTAEFDKLLPNTVVALRRTEAKLLAQRGSVEILGDIETAMDNPQGESRTMTTKNTFQVKEDEPKPKRTRSAKKG